MYEEEKKPPKRKTKKPGQWSPLDLLMGAFGLVALVALSIAAFKVAKWAMGQFF